MKQISRQLLNQRLRNRVIELLELHSSAEDVAGLGAFTALNMVDDWLPLDYGDAPNVFSNDEKEAITTFLKLVDCADNATEGNTWDADRFKTSPEWSELLNFSRQSLTVFMERGRQPEDREEASLE